MRNVSGFDSAGFTQFSISDSSDLTGLGKEFVFQARLFDQERNQWQGMP